jgi:hypothetical protein
MAFMHAWWSGTLTDFRQSDPTTILGILSTRLVETHAVNRDTQIFAWRKQIEVLSDATTDLSPDVRLLLEYPLLRLGRRIDAVLVTRAVILVLEFKVGARPIAESDRRQVEDYALDLQDFHAGSLGQSIIPIVIATNSKVKAPQWRLHWHQVSHVFDANAQCLRDLLKEVVHRVGEPSRAINVTAWEAAPYRPVPTIVDAARTLYGRHGIEDMRTARSDVGNLTRTTDAIVAAVADARVQRHHVVVFVTSIPGAGKCPFENFTSH